MTARPSPADVIAKWRPTPRAVMGGALPFDSETPPCQWTLRDTEAISLNLIAALEAAGYRIVAEQALDKLVHWSREDIDDPYVMGWIAGWYESHVEGRPPYSAPTSWVDVSEYVTDVRVQHGDTWTARNGRAVVVASNDWPPPQPGSHESDLYRKLGIEMADCDAPPDLVDSSAYRAARDWSRANQEHA